MCSQKPSSCPNGWAVPLPSSHQPLRCILILFWRSKGPLMFSTLQSESCFGFPERLRGFPDISRTLFSSVDTRGQPLWKTETEKSLSKGELVHRCSWAPLRSTAMEEDQHRFVFEVKIWKKLTFTITVPRIKQKLACFWRVWFPSSLLDHPALTEISPRGSWWPRFEAVSWMRSLCGSGRFAALLRHLKATPQTHSHGYEVGADLLDRQYQYSF